MLTYVIIEDEAPSLEELAFLLAPFEGFECVGSAQNGEQGLALIKYYRPDIIFLDVNMPKVDGLSLASGLKYLQKKPVIVFTTAFREYAADAFELGALDYLLKPYDEKRIVDVIDRIRKYFDMQLKHGTQSEGLRVDKKNQPDKQNRLAGLFGDRTRLIPIHAIYYVYSDKEKLWIVSEEGTFECTYTLSEIVDRTTLFRIHRCTLVNLERVKELYPWFNGTYQVTLNHPENINLTVSRSYVKSLKQALL